MSKKIIILILLFAILPVGRAHGSVLRDDFTTNWDYSAAGTVPPGGIWSGIYNSTAGGIGTKANVTNADQLTMGMDNVGWENNNDSAPFLYKQLNATDFVRATAKITSQSVGGSSLAGIMVRLPNPIDNAPNQENWYAAWSFRAAADDIEFQSNKVTSGSELENNTAGLTEAAVSYVRVEAVAGSPGRYATFRSADGINWIAGPANSNAASSTHPNLGSGIVQIGIAGGMAPNSSGVIDPRVQFDWVQIETSGLDPCTTCTWKINGSGNWNTSTNWIGSLNAPNANTVAAVFGSSFTGTVATVYSDTNVSVKELQFNNAASKYVVAGPGQITLDADSGNALVNVLAGTHEIQAHLALADDVTATAAAGTTLNINTNVQLNGHTFSTSGAGTINLNNGTVGGAGSGALVNGASLTGLSGVDGDLTQTADGSLGVLVGGAAIRVTGAAVLDGVLDVSLTDGFTPRVGQTYSILNAQSVTNLGLSLGGDAAGEFRLNVGAESLSLTAVPEPCAALLILLGGCGLVSATRRQLFGRRR